MKKRGGAYVSEVHKYKGKTRRIPANPTFREAVDFVEYMGIKTVEDERQMRLIGYEARYEPKPAPDADRWEVKRIDAELAKLAPEQAELLLRTCAAFGVPFEGVSDVLYGLQNYKSKRDYAVSDYGDFGDSEGSEPI